MLFFDIETDGLLDDVSKMHVLSIYDGHQNKFFRFDPASTLPFGVGLKMLADADEICGHNIIGYDIPALKKLFPGWEPRGVVHDTLVYARVLWPDIRTSDFGRVQQKRLPGKLIGSHSLKAWGYRLGVFKGKFAEETDWKTWTPEMSTYCDQDVRVTIRLWEAIQKKGCPEETRVLEHAVAEIIQRQQRHGFLFNAPACHQLYLELLDKRETLRREMCATFPPFYKMRGTKTFTPKRDNAQLGYVADCEMTKIELTEFNPGSSQHIYSMLIRKYGWKPNEFTKKSYAPQWIRHLFPDVPTGERAPEPVINEDILKSLDYPEAKPLAEFMMLDKRIGQMAEGNQAWLKVFNPTDQRIHGAVNPNGAVTTRMTHFYPNMAQVPAARAPYGKECRSFFFVKVGKKLVGCDASGLEARCLAHFMAKYDGGEYAKIVVEGNSKDGTDVHSINAKRTGLSRDDAKTFFYAFMYGAGDQKLGSITKPFASPEAQRVEGAKLRKKFMKALPALAKLTDAVKAKVKAQGWLRAIDGRKLFSRSEHSALNLLLQSAGALIMKKALVLCDAEMQRRGYIPGVHYEFVVNVHDEWQAEVDTDVSEEFGRVSEDAIRLAGEHFGWRCPLGGEAKIGDNWYETH